MRESVARANNLPSTRLLGEASTAHEQRLTVVLAKRFRVFSRVSVAHFVVSKARDGSPGAAIVRQGRYYWCSIASTGQERADRLRKGFAINV